MSTKSTEAVELFYCYSHADEELRKELEKHLAPLKRQGYLSGWHNRQIEAGADWQQEIELHLSAANLILLLLSPDFMHSDACDKEMRQAMTLHSAGRARVIPILLRPVLWEGTQLARLEGLPENGQPITTWPNQDQAFRQIAFCLANIVRKQLNLPPLQAQDWQSLLSPSHQEIASPSQLVPHDFSHMSDNPYGENTILNNDSPQINTRRLPTFSSAHSRLQVNLRHGLTCVQSLWYYEVRDWVTCVHAADINRDGDVEVLASSRDGRVCALTRDGRLKWENVIGEKKWVTAIGTCPVFTELREACVAVSTGDGKIYVLNQQGEEIPSSSDETAPTYWFDAQHPILQMEVDASQPFTVVFSTEDSYVYSFDIAHNQLSWCFSTPTGDPIRAIFTCDVNGDGLSETLVGSDNQYLYVLSTTGELLATRKMDQAIYTLFAADIDNDGKIEILVGTRSKKLFSLTPELQERWVGVLSSRPLAISIADVNNDRSFEILVACDDRSLSILDKAGKLIWRQKLGKRFPTLNTFDLDRDGHIEVLAGTDDSQICAFRIQLTKDLDKKIRRDYAVLGKPDASTLDLTREQLNLLLDVLGFTSSIIDKKLSLTLVKSMMKVSNFTGALLALLKLAQQKFQLLWEKESVGYRPILCLPNLMGDKRRGVIVSSQDGGFSVFNTKGRLLWSERAPVNEEFFDVQSGYLSSDQSEDLVFITTSGTLSSINHERVPQNILRFPESATCFYILAPGSLRASDILIGTKSGKVYLYTNTFEIPSYTIELPAAIQNVYASAPDESGKYQTPELLISTSDNVLFAYTRGGNCLWTYSISHRVLALCARDLDGDGHLEVLIGTEGRTIYALDDDGNLRWRYILYDSVLALETADIDNDGKQEILVGCGDGMLYVFTSGGDLAWRYSTRDRIQALRVSDIDIDGNFEIILAQENHLEVLQIVNQKELNELIGKCWTNLLTGHDPLKVLFSLIQSHDPDLRAAGLTKIATLNPLPPETLDLLSNATNDAFTTVKKILPEALMHAYPADPVRAQKLLNILFSERILEVRIEVVEHLELLAYHDWNIVQSYLERILSTNELNTRRAALRKIAHLIRDFANEIKDSQFTLGKAFFKLLLIAAQDVEASWIREEAGRVLADFFNLFEDEFLPYLYRLFSCQLNHETLTHIAYNLKNTIIQKIVINLLALKFEFDRTALLFALSEVTRALRIVSSSEQIYAWSIDLWLICHELLELFKLSTIEKLASYNFQSKSEQFQTTIVPYPYAQSFLLIGTHLETITRPLKTYLRRDDPNDRLNSLLDSIDALEVFERIVNREYGASSLPNVPQPSLPEFVVLNALITHWHKLLNAQRHELRGYPDLKCSLQSRTVHLEETVGIWFQVANHGRASARQVKVTLLSDKSFTIDRHHQFVSNDMLLAGQEVTAEFLIKPLKNPVTLTFETAYDDAEHELYTILYQERLDFIELPQTFKLIENPYTTGTPLHDSTMFYGREASLADLLKNFTHITAQTVLVLYGPRRAGKTTLLNQLANTDLLIQHIPVMIDMQNWSYGLNLSKFLFNISYAIYRVMNKRSVLIPEPQQKDFFDQPDPIFFFEVFLDKVELSLENRKLILILDEFEILEAQVKKGNLQSEIFEYLRSLIQRKWYMHFLFSGTHQIEKMTREYWSVFFNIALHYRLSSKISPPGARALITEPVSGFLEYESQVVEKIRLLTADQPYLIHLVCRALVNHCNERKKNYATLNDVNLVLNEVFATGTVHFDWLWERFEQSQQLLLQVIAEGSRDERRTLDIDDIRAIYQRYHYPYLSSEVMSALQTLWSEDIVETNDGKQWGNISDNARYMLANGLLRQWLRSEKPLKDFGQ